jgi:hypothetical protein
MKMTCRWCERSRVRHLLRRLEEWLLDRGLLVPKRNDYLACHHFERAGASR